MIILTCALGASLAANERLSIEGEEVEAISCLIEATSSQLAVQRELKGLMEQFLQFKKQFMQGQEEKKAGFQMVKASRKILDLLKEEHLEGVVSKGYLEELTFFSTL